MRFQHARGLTFREIMVLGAIYSAAVILVEVPTGAFADRIGRKVSMMFGALAMVASCVVATTAHSFLVFAVAEFFAAMSMALCSGADSAYLYDYLEKNDEGESYPRREGTASAWHQVGSAAAFACGGFLAQIDMTLPYYVTAGVAFCAFILAALLSSERLPDAPLGGIRKELASYRKQMGAAVRDVFRSSNLLRTIFYSSLVFLLLRATIYLYQPFLESRGFSLAETGLVFAGVYILAAFFAKACHRLRRTFGESTLYWGLLAILAVSYLALGQVQSHFVLVLLGVQAFANGLYSPLVKPMLNRMIPSSERRASVLSIESIGRRLGIVLFWPLVGLYGKDISMFLSGTAAIVGIAVLVIWHAVKRDSKPV